jgi:hypothetical protein
VAAITIHGIHEAIKGNMGKVADNQIQKYTNIFIYLTDHVCVLYLKGKWVDKIEVVK